MFEFPPRPSLFDLRLSTVVIHLVLLAVAVLVLRGAIRQPLYQSRTPFRLWLAAVVVMFVSAYVATVVTAHEISQPFVVGYFLFGLLCSIIGAVRANRSPDSEGTDKHGFQFFGVFMWFTVLAGLLLVLLPSVPSARGATRRTQCKNNLKQIALAMLNFHDVHEHFPSASGRWPQDAAEGPDVSWRVALLPYLEQQSLFNDYDTKQPWDSPANLPVARRLVREYQCPSWMTKVEEPPDALRRTSYIVPTGVGTIFGDAKQPGLTLGVITDGTSNTLLVVEACGTDIVWTEPRDLNIDAIPPGINLPGSKPGQSDGIMSSYHSGGAQAALADGSVQFISQNIDQSVLKGIMTANGGEKSQEF